MLVELNLCLAELGRLLLEQRPPECESKLLTVDDAHVLGEGIPGGAVLIVVPGIWDNGVRNDFSKCLTQSQV